MALLNSIGLFNDHGPEVLVGPVPSPTRIPDVPQRGEFRPQPTAGLLGGDVKTFPYTDLIREHLALGRILDARNLLEFARDLLPPNSKLLKVLAPPRIKKSDQLGADRSAEFRWLQANGAKYQGQWVALTGDGLFASAATLAELLAELKASPPPVEPLIHHLI